MNRLIILLTLNFFTGSIFAQNLYPEKFKDCELQNFCLDCGDPKAQPPATIMEELKNGFDKESLRTIKGIVEVQILIDDKGKACLLSAQNNTNISSGKLNLQTAINNTSAWAAAVSENKHVNSSVSVIFEFDSSGFTAKRRIFDFANQMNEKSVGTPEVKGTEKEKLTETWTVYTQENSELPWDMTRAVVNDLDNNIWIGTDNGIVKIENGKWVHFNSKNTGIAFDAVRDMEVDKENNKWFIMGWNVYKYDNKKWTKYDSVNSPINWARTIFVDRHNNIWFSSWNGVARFDGEIWTVYDKKSSNLPTDKTVSVYVDAKDRIWIGTFDGNVMIENGRTVKLADNNSPLSKGYISQMLEDKNGNMWFAVHDQQSKVDGIYILDKEENWHGISHPDPEMFRENGINCFLLDEDKDQLWVTVNGVGILKYDIAGKQWEAYTNENSNVPSIHIEKIAKDGNGAIWAATYAGVIKLNKKK